MSFRFLPWVRRGLAAELPDADSLGVNMAARARLPVRVTLAHGPEVPIELQLYGPGDVTGLDTRAIIRIEPRRNTTNFEPDKFAAIEFDPPDLAWMLSPAKAGTNDRLRPWLALVVVAQQPGVDIDVAPNRPLPRLTIEAPASPAAELPDLSESWAWAHGQLVEASTAGNVPDKLAADPDLNVSRLLCPRRLEPDRAYFACLVPTTEAGRLAGLGQDVPDAATTGPAWGSGGTVILPLYYHWSFRTGPAGDFESLAEKLEPRPIPDSVGRRPMFIGAADPALPALAPDAGGVLMLEGALRAPEPGTGTEATPDQDFVDALVELLDAPSAHVLEGASPDAEAVAPPIYGQWPVRQHTVPANLPRWLRELNVDPRHRAAAGLGAQVVRVNQERYVDAAWKQVGDVIAANRLLDVARLMQRIGERIHSRHVAPLGVDALFGVTMPVHPRILLSGQTVERRLKASFLPPGATDPSFRRLAAPQSQVLRHAARLSGGVPIASVTVFRELALGRLKLDLVTRRPDGILSSSLLAGLQGGSTGDVSGAPLGLPGRTPATLVAEWASAQTRLQRRPPGSLVLRPNVALSGVVTDRQLERVTLAAGVHGSVFATLGLLVERSLANRESVGFVLPVGGGEVEVLELRDGVIGVRTGRGPTRPLAEVDAEAIGGSERERVAELIGRLPAGVFDPAASAPTVPGLRATGGAAVRQPFDPIPGRPPAPSVDPPVSSPRAIADLTRAFRAHLDAFEPTVAALRPPPVPLDLAGLQAELARAVDPTAVIERRALGRLRVGAGKLSDLTFGDRLRVSPDLGPIMAGPLLPDALYRDLAAHDQDRFLPGVGLIPADTVTLLETNARFVEAFLIGANHEMNRELLWRRYPTDRRGTPFHHFWDRLDGGSDIGPIHQFRSNARLGTNSVDQLEGSLVLLVRGELLRRYPNSVVYAVPAGADGLIPPAAPITLPLFAGTLDPDVTFVGFDLTVEDVTPAPGWFFVIQEQPTEPRFGLDVPDGTGGATPQHWGELDWDQVGVPPGSYLRLAATSLMGRTLPLADRPGPAISVGAARFGHNAGHMAAITFQRPFRAAIHSSKVLE